VQYYATNNVFENNILYANPQGLFVNDFTTSEAAPVALDYNLYYSTVGAANGAWIWQGNTYIGWASYLSGTGMDGHSPNFSDPQFVDTAALPPDLDILPTSPAINAGANLGAYVVGATDYAGAPRTNSNGQINIGAYEQ
jgi:hypothetical protein